MKQYLYAIRDAKNTFLAPLCDSNDSSAVRNFDIACKAPDSMIRRYPADFSLWCIGSYDTETGDIVPEHRMVIDATSLVFRKEYEGADDSSREEDQ